MLVTKIGGSLVDESSNVLTEVVRRSEPTVLAHGFGPQTDRVCRARGIEVRRVRSPTGATSRFTDEEVLEAMQTAARQARDELLARLEALDAGVASLGVDPPLVRGEAKAALRHERSDGRVVLVRGNRSGRVTGVDTEPIEESLHRERLPLVTPLACDERGPLSVDADRASAAIAGQLDADALLLLTDVPGVLGEPGDPGSRLDRIHVEEVETLIGDTARGGMLRKLVAAREAIEAGVDRVLVADGTRSHPIEAALEADATEVVR